MVNRPECRVVWVPKSRRRIHSNFGQVGGTQPNTAHRSACHRRSHTPAFWQYWANWTNVKTLILSLSDAMTLTGLATECSLWNVLQIVTFQSLERWTWIRQPPEHCLVESLYKWFQYLDYTRVDSKTTRTTLSLIAIKRCWTSSWLDRLFRPVTSGRHWLNYPRWWTIH